MPARQKTRFIHPRNKKFCPVRLGGGGRSRAGGRAGGRYSTLGVLYSARLLVWLGCSPPAEGPGNAEGPAEGPGNAGTKGAGLRGARACRGHSYGPRLLTASTHPARHPPLTFTPAFAHSTGLPSSHSTPRRVHSCPPARILFKLLVVCPCGPCPGRRICIDPGGNVA